VCGGQLFSKQRSCTGNLRISKKKLHEKIHREGMPPAKKGRVQGLTAGGELDSWLLSARAHVR